jgi:hypothetical protein
MTFHQRLEFQLNLFQSLYKEELQPHFSNNHEIHTAVFLTFQAQYFFRDHQQYLKFLEFLFVLEE